MPCPNVETKKKTLDITKAVRLPKMQVGVYNGGKTERKAEGSINANQRVVEMQEGSYDSVIESWKASCANAAGEGIGLQQRRGGRPCESLGGLQAIRKAAGGVERAARQLTGVI